MCLGRRRKTKAEPKIKNKKEKKMSLPGSGLDSSEQGAINIPVLPHQDAVSVLRANESTTPYTGTGVTGVFDINPLDIMFRVSSLPNKEIIKPLVLSTLSGLGSDAADKFPDNDKMLLECIENDIEVVGVSSQKFDMEGSRYRHGVSAIRSGVRNIHAYTQLPYGVTVKAVPLTPSQYRTDGFKMPSGTIGAKFPLVAVPYDPRSVGEKFKTNMTNYLSNPMEYAQCMEPKYKSSSKRIAALETQNLSDLTKGLLFIEQLVKIGIIDPIKFKDRTIFDLSHGNPTSQTEILLALAQALGVLGNNTYNIPNISMSQAQQNAFVEAKRQILMSMYWSGEIANLGFGWDDDTGTNPGTNGQTGKVQLSTAHGKMLNAQFNLWRASVSAMGDWVSSDRKNILGTIVKGSEIGGKAAVL
jgi:hypothetical protein